MRSRISTWSILVLLLPVSACFVPMFSSPEIDFSPKAEEDLPGWRSQPMNPFPEAARVDLVYHDLSIEIDAQGRANEEAWAPVTLSPAHARSLRRALVWTVPPAGHAICCVPRHAFLFHDAEGRFLGSVTICIRCGCWRTNGLEHPEGLDWLRWDARAIGRILARNGVPGGDEYATAPQRGS